MDYHCEGRRRALEKIEEICMSPPGSRIRQERAQEIETLEKELPNLKKMWLSHPYTIGKLVFIFTLLPVLSLLLFLRAHSTETSDLLTSAPFCSQLHLHQIGLPALAASLSLWILPNTVAISAFVFVSGILYYFVSVCMPAAQYTIAGPFLVGIAGAVYASAHGLFKDLYFTKFYMFGSVVAYGLRIALEQVEDISTAVGSALDTVKTVAVKEILETVRVYGYENGYAIISAIFIITVSICLAHLFILKERVHPSVLYVLFFSLLLLPVTALHLTVDKMLAYATDLAFGIGLPIFLGPLVEKIFRQRLYVGDQAKVYMFLLFFMSAFVASIPFILHTLNV